MFSFATKELAQDHISREIDQPTDDLVRRIGDSVVMHSFFEQLPDGRFTNVYDLSYPAELRRAEIELTSQPSSVYSSVSQRTDIDAAMSGGFFFLADSYSLAPRQHALNLAVTNNQLRSLPVVDREALLVRDGRLRAEQLRAIGVLSINGVDLSWSGSLTAHQTDVKVYGNGNAIIEHKPNEITGSMRVLDEGSRFTPDMVDDDTIDVGFVDRGDGVFAGRASSRVGGVDIFSHDIVVRMPEQQMSTVLPELRIRSIDSHDLEGGLAGGITVGPMLSETDFASHPINHDRSLGDLPPFLPRAMARTAIYETNEGIVHMRVYDGRPGSQVMPGVTAEYVAQAILEQNEIRWGCFLDPGQTSKLVTRNGNQLAS